MSEASVSGVKVKKRPKPRRKRIAEDVAKRAASALKASPSKSKAESRRGKKAKPRKVKTGEVSLVSLPGAPMRIPEGLKEGRKGQGSAPADNQAGRRAKRRKARPPQLNITALISKLPTRTMAELRGQWLNLLRMIETGGETKALLASRQALIVEWARRYQLALDDPDHFDWPSTAAGPADGSLRPGGWHPEGLLSYLGYRVGEIQGVGRPTRRNILDVVFGQPLPPVNSATYMRGWGSPSSPARLHKLANELASFARNAKRKRSADMSRAIGDWEDDLRYLHDKDYVEKFHFGWPRVL